MEQYVCKVENAPQIAEWLKTRGGIAIWQSIDFSNLDASWTAPLNDANGQRKQKPNWQSDNEPARIITDPAEVFVSVDKEVKRFHVGVRMGGQGLTMKVTDGGTRRIRSEVAKAGKGAYYVFDYSTQEAVIMAPTEAYKPLPEFLASHRGENSN